MFQLRQQSPQRYRKVSLLRQCLRRPETYLALLGLLLTTLVLDSFRSPSRQVTSKLYVRGVHVYQVFGRPLLNGRIVCRYHPSCSVYSVEAVERHGIRWGLVLSVRRIKSCTVRVRPGTFDPVPTILGMRSPL